ncbi:MAG: PPOX class F420-dependent oxidoreductase [Mycobacterium sp.]
MVNESIPALAKEQFVALTTFKRNGDGISTPMWIGRDGADLFMWTAEDSWKVKRVRNNPRVLLAPSGRFGKVRDGVLPVEGTAEVLTDPDTVERLRRVIQRKYGLGYWIITTVEMIAARGRKKRVVLRIALND